MFARFATVIFVVMSMNSTKTNASEPIENKLYPFETNGCSYSPDGTKVEPTKWQHCCVQHDLKYWMGGTAADRKQADADIKACIGDIQNELVGNMYYLVLRVAGSGPHHWGYGWKYSKGEAEFSEKEKNEVAALAPTDLSKVEISASIQKRLEAYPTPTGDYCLDELNEYAAANHDGARVTKITGVDKVHETISFSVSNCKAPMIARLAANKLTKCTEAHYEDKPSTMLKSVHILGKCE